MKSLKLLAFLGISALVAFQSPASASAAQPLAEVKSPAVSQAMMLTLNKSNIIRLEEDAASVIVSNPNHISVLLDTPRVVVIIPRQPGATSFTILNEDGDSILEKDVIVTSREKQYIRVSRACPESVQNCVPEERFYCPDGCYSVTPQGEEGTTSGEIADVEGNGDFLATTGEEE